MNKSELAKKLAQASEISEQEAQEFLEAFTTVMADNFKKGEKVVLAEFGSFYIRDDHSIQFNPSARLKEQVQQQN